MESAIKIWFSLVIIVILLDTQALAENFVFENDRVKFVLTSEGGTRSLFEKETQKEWLWKQDSRFFQIKKLGKRYPATRIKRNKDELEVIFAGSGIIVNYRIIEKPNYFVIELIEIHGGEIEQISLGKFVPAITENIGNLLTGRWNKKFAVCWIGLSDCVRTTNTGAMVYSEYGMIGEKVALIAAPTNQLLDIIQGVERDYHLPVAMLHGQWAKQSDDIRYGYLFTNLSEKNVDETIRLAKLAGFRYILIHSSTWTSSRGSYPINKKNFPGGEASLRATIDKCHKAGLKVGMHMLTSFVARHDPLVTPIPDPRLLKDAEAVLAHDISKNTVDIVSKTALVQFPAKVVFYGAPKQGFDIQIGEEIIHYRSIGGPDGRTLLKCIRGYMGTRKTAHNEGEKIYHLCQRHGNYLVDLHTSLKDELAERVAGIVNRCGFDMIYFDGGEGNRANGPGWYWIGHQQMAIWKRFKRDVLVQGSGLTPWTWHIFSRMTCDDFAAVAPKQFLDYHKIANSWKYYRRNLMPAELGWWGFFDDSPDHPATLPDEVEFYATRMMALDAPVSLETSIKKLKANGRTDELLELLGKYEKLRIGKFFPQAIRKKLQTGEWHLSNDVGNPSFQPIRYDVRHTRVPGDFEVDNQFTKQSFKFRMQIMPQLASTGDPDNILLFQAVSQLQPLPIPEPKSAMPGALAGIVEFVEPEGKPRNQSLVISGAINDKLLKNKAINLLKHRALAVTLKVDSLLPQKGERYAVLNIQLESTRKRYREHYIDLNFVGERTIIIPEPTTERMLPEFRPAPKNYRYKMAGYSFDYRKIVALNFRWMGLPKGREIRCTIKRVEALREKTATLIQPTIKLASDSMMFPASMKTGDYLEFWGTERARLFDRNGNVLKTIKLERKPLDIPYGKTKVELTAASTAPVRWTTITLGNPLTHQK